MRLPHSRRAKTIFRDRCSAQTIKKQSKLILVTLTICCSSLLLGTAKNVSATEAMREKESPSQQDEQQISKQIPANHRMDTQDGSDVGNKQTTSSGGRSGRQYDGSMSTSGTGSYASLASDTGAFIGGQLPLMSGSGVFGSGSGSQGAASGVGGVYASDLGAGAFHEPIGRGYSPMHHSAAGGAYGGPSSMGPHQMSPPFGPLSSMFGGGGSGGMFSNPMFPLTAKGFDVSEIICSAIAVAIGAVIVGAPFILLYLFIMNQMGANGGGPSALGPSGGAISLTGPSSSTNVSGRKKRHTTFPEALFKQLSPLVNNEQLANTFKMLLNSIAKHQT